jgi:hypothetical protein
VEPRRRVAAFVAGQRPGALPMIDVPTVLHPPQLRAAGVDPGQAALICELAEDLARDLADAGGVASPPVVVHGDFTSHNVLADGTPPRLTGVIDFAGAHVETPVADIGYGRSSVPSGTVAAWRRCTNGGVRS